MNSSSEGYAVVHDPVGIFRAFLKSKGRKLTAQRTLIVRAILSCPRRFTVRQVMEVLRRDRRKVARATVERTLVLLCEAGTVEEVPGGSGERLYERVAPLGPHDRLVCIGCSKVVELPPGGLGQKPAELAGSHGFTFKYHTMKVFGLCSKCLSPANRGIPADAQPDTADRVAHR